ncbi:hypothetical protein [Streptomyces sp. NPDC048603]|uniref:hypothetical protein n=1 Tax=Streptomyces sp. NPDC048603 TaxID=3365577 RepID=UPI003713D46B
MPYEGNAGDEGTEGTPQERARQGAEHRDRAYQEHARTARRAVTRLYEDPQTPSPVARRLRAVLAERLPADGLDALRAFERDPYGPLVDRTLEAAVCRLANTDREFARELGELAVGRLGDRAEGWARREEAVTARAGCVAVMALLVAIALALGVWVVLVDTRPGGGRDCTGGAYTVSCTP